MNFSNFKKEKQNITTNQAYDYENDDVKENLNDILFGNCNDSNNNLKTNTNNSIVHTVANNNKNQIMNSNEIISSVDKEFEVLLLGKKTVDEIKFNENSHLMHSYFTKDLSIITEKSKESGGSSIKTTKNLNQKDLGSLLFNNSNNENGYLHSKFRQSLEQN